jgi:hypothetical protein
VAGQCFAVLIYRGGRDTIWHNSRAKDKHFFYEQISIDPQLLTTVIDLHYADRLFNSPANIILESM